jgi:ADP-ribose pyrophosphatase YjhB (NUDIX family)
VTDVRIPTVFVALTVVRDGDRYLLVEEHTGLWSIPGGRADPGEHLTDAAIRECREESGVEIALESILRFEQTPMGSLSRVRAFFLARPTGGALKTIEDEHSRRARWFTRAEIDALEIRFPGYLRAIQHVESGGRLYPLELLVTESSPW